MSMQQLSNFTGPNTSHASTPDPAVDIVLYLVAAFMGYHLFRAALMFGALYIERMSLPAARRITKLCEYGCLAASASLISWAVTTYQSGLYYSLDIVLAGLLIYVFVKGDRVLRSEYLNAHQTSKQKTVNRLIVNLGHSVFGRDN